jgi:four helix bundle protein
MSEKVTRFEDLIAWQKARELTKAIYIQTNSGKFSKDFGLSNQIQRSVVSVMSNIAEGFERQTTNDYLRFINISKSSCAEVRSQLYVALDIGYISQDVFQSLSELAEEIARLLGGLRNSLERRRSS